MSGLPWLVSHSGSPTLGAQVCGVYQRAAHEERSRVGIQSTGYLKEGFIERLKADGNQELIGCDVSFMVVLISERHGGFINCNDRIKNPYLS